jgi:hypothetical protein
MLSNAKSARSSDYHDKLDESATIFRRKGFITEAELDEAGIMSSIPKDKE